MLTIKNTDPLLDSREFNNQRTTVEEATVHSKFPPALKRFSYCSLVSFRNNIHGEMFTDYGVKLGKA